MNSDVRETIEMARTVGWDLIGQFGDGHLKLKHKSGAIGKVAGTPSDWRTIVTDRKNLWRVSGAPPRKKVAGKFRKGVSSRRNEPKHLSSTAEVEASREKNALLRKHERLLIQLKAAQVDPAACDRDAIGAAIGDLFECRGQMEALGFDVPLLPFRL